jgi:chymotrypsin
MDCFFTNYVWWITFCKYTSTSIDLIDNHILNLQCGGTLVDALHVVTASHCFDQAGTSPENFKVVAGLLNLRQTSAAGVQQFAVERIFRHEQYSSTALVNDITVIKLRTPAQFSEAVYPICLPSGNGAQDPPVGQNVLIAGWGYTNSATKQISDQLQQATIQILDFNGDLYGGPGCNAWARRGYSLSSSRQICAMSRDTRIDSCQGDSGGPLIGEVQSRWYLFGIVSYGDSVCASSTAAGVYTRVSAYTAWVQQKLLL